jgi:hypothetical protein
MLRADRGEGEPRIAYVVALAGDAIIWPWVVLLGLMAASFVGGRLLYGERGGDAGEK